MERSDFTNQICKWAKWLRLQHGNNGNSHTIYSKFSITAGVCISQLPSNILLMAWTSWAPKVWFFEKHGSTSSIWTRRCWAEDTFFTTRRSSLNTRSTAVMISPCSRKCTVSRLASCPDESARGRLGLREQGCSSSLTYTEVLVSSRSTTTDGTLHTYCTQEEDQTLLKGWCASLVYALYLQPEAGANVPLRIIYSVVFKDSVRESCCHTHPCHRQTLLVVALVYSHSTRTDLYV